MTREYDNFGRDQINAETVQNLTFNQTQIIQLSTTEIKTRPFNPTSPYRGLKRFDREDKDYFFGRDQCLTGLVNELEQTNVILLLGASGSGKSSVVRAGLIPWLGQKWGSDFVELILTPDHDPFESLYACLLGHYRQSEAQMGRAGSANTLSQVVKTLKQPESFWLIFIDQLEELFTTSQPEQRDRFICSLVQLSQERSQDPSLKIVLTMRSDFLDRLDLDPANLLAMITHSHRPLITQMHRDELRLAIEQPAARHGVVFEADLVETIVNDVQGQAGYLPLLQYTLNRLWEEELAGGEMQQERTLHTRTYLRLGGVRGALQRHVDEIYAGFEQAGNHLATQRIFLKLVEIGGDAESGTDWKPVRRRANRSEFKDEQEKAVLAQLIDQMLVVSDRDLPAPDQESTVEIAHEILLTSWTTLDGWIKENRRAIALRNRLNDDVARWQTKQADDELWTGSKLEQVLELRNDPTFNDVLGGFSPIANQFIDASAGRRDRETQAQLEQERRLREAAEARELVEIEKKLEAEGRAEAEAKITEEVLARINAERQKNKWLVVTVFLLTGITVLAVILKNLAEQREKTIVDGMIAESKQLLDENKQLEAMVSAVKVMKHMKGQRSDIPSSLQKIVGQIQEVNRLEGHTDEVSEVSFSKDGKNIISSSFDRTVRIWSSEGRLLKELKHDDGRPVWGANLSSDSRLLVVANNDGIIRLWHLEKNEVQKLRPSNLKEKDFILKTRFSPDLTTIASAYSNDSGNGSIKIWSISDGKLLKEIITENKSTKVLDVTFSPNGEVIASGHSDSLVRLWNSKSSHLLKTLSGHKKLIFSVKFSPDGSTIASASWDKTVKLWDVRTGRLLKTLEGHDKGVNSVSFSPDGKLLGSASKDETIKVWQVSSGKLLQTLRGHNDSVNSIAFNYDGRTIISSSDDRTIRLWSLEPIEVPKNSLATWLEKSCYQLRNYLENGYKLSLEERSICKE